MYLTCFFLLLKNVATVQFKGTKVSCFYYCWAVLGSSVSRVSTTQYVHVSSPFPERRQTGKD